MRRPPAHRGRARRRFPLLVLAFLGAGAAALVFAATAGADAISPESGPSSNAKDIDTLYKIVFFMGLAVIGFVWTVLIYSLFRFRARRGAVAPQIRGNTPLELGWTIAAGVIVIAIATVTFVLLDNIENPASSGPERLAEARGQNAVLDQPPPASGEPLNIQVSGQQFLWRYRYPNGAVSFHDLIAPRDTTVTLDITSNDVAHSWWIPELGGKTDALRGYTNETWFKATETGTFRGQCAEFCGANHAFMTAKVIVVEPDAYERWVEDQKALIDDARQAVATQREQRQVPGQEASQPSGGSSAPEGADQQRPGQGPLAGAGEE
jgi:cytochrome c oxidase subunit 2